MSNEEWKQIPDYPNYYVSNLGRVRSEAQRKPKELKTCGVRGRRAAYKGYHFEYADESEEGE